MTAQCVLLAVIYQSVAACSQARQYWMQYHLCHSKLHPRPNPTSPRDRLLAVPTALASACPTCPRGPGAKKQNHRLPVIQEIVLKDPQEGPGEVLQRPPVVLQAAHVCKQTLRGVPDL